MNHRYVELQGLTTLADGDITTIDLDMADPISELLLDLRGYPQQTISTAITSLSERNYRQ